MYLQRPCCCAGLSAYEKANYNQKYIILYTRGINEQDTDDGGADLSESTILLVPQV